MNLLDRAHHRFFALASWRRALEGHGYGIEALQGINPLYLGRNPLKVAAKSALITFVGPDNRFLQFAWRATPKP